MATTTTTGLVDATFVVNAYGTSAGGIWPHFNLLIDGAKVGEGTASATAKDFTFTSAVALNSGHKVQVQYDNDAYVNGQDRSLLVNAVTVNGKTIAPTAPIVTYDKGALDGKDVVAGQSGMWWNGTLVVNADTSYFPLPTPTAGASTIVVNAQGNPAAGVNAHFKLLVDGVKVGEGTTGTTAKDFAFTTDAATGTGHKVQVQYDNDATINGQDRSLIVNKITVNGHGYAPADPVVSYDKGALDGKDVVAGQSGMWWNGTLVVNAPAGDFPASSTGTTPPPTGPAFYVATNGKDGWSGKLAAPNADGTDGPFASLQAAQQAMRASSTDVTYVRGGDYYMKDMVWLDGQDSGVRFAAYGAEKPVFHGGTLVDDWVSRGNGLWSAQLPTGAKSVLDLSMDGERQALARTPNADPAHPIDGGWLIATKSAAGTDPTTQITFKPGDIPAGTSANGLMVSAFGQHGYDDVLVPVNSIDFTKNVITLAQGTWDGFGEGSRYYLYNSKDQLDAAKEWFYDSGSNQILFRPEGGTPVGHKIVASQLNVLFGMGGAKNVTVDGLTLADGGPSGHGVYAQGADGLTFTHNVVKNTGYGITVESSPNAKVTGNSFDHTGLEAVFVKMGSNFADVSNNRVEYAGAVDHGSDGVWVNGSSDVTVSHNLIEHTAGKAISVGSVQATGDETYRATITYNKVVDSNRETSDGGGIYLINRQQTATGDVVAYNDVSGTSAFGNVKWDGSVSPTWLDPKQLVSWGIYLDDWTSGATVKGNVVHGNLGGVFLHGGWNNQVSNNIIAGNAGREIGLQQSVGYGGWKGTPMSGNDIHHNVIDATASHGLTVAIDGPKNAGTFHDNDYSSLDPNALLFQVWPQAMAGTQGTLKDWQAAGYDTNALTLNPLFTNPAAGDYSLLAGSPMYQHGFETIHTDQIGPVA